MNSLTAEASIQPHETARNADRAGFHDAPKAATVIEKGRRYYALVLNRMGVSGTGQVVAAKLELSESTITRAKEDLERGCAVIAALDLKLVPAAKVCVDPGEIAFLRGLYDRVKAQTPWLLDAGDE